MEKVLSGNEIDRQLTTGRELFRVGWKRDFLFCSLCLQVRAEVCRLEQNLDDDNDDSGGFTAPK